MNSSVFRSKTSNPLRRIASNKFLTREGVLQHPLIELDDRGEVVRIVACAEPDREPYTEFYAGLLVMGLQKEGIERVKISREPLHEWLPKELTEKGGLHLLTGLDYTTMTPTEKIKIEKIG